MTVFNETNCFKIIENIFVKLNVKFMSLYS
jgi:hypothetical protein